ncbi:MAG TPA: hypothetical protein PKC91_13575 [Ignavibacteria bacterium]|nr:hypothetical protein [Ignavibacteria bacterium]
MEDSKLIQTLKTFTKDELKLFEKFVSSPYFNNGRNYIPFLTEIKKHYPSFENRNGNFTSENIYSQLYPGRKFNKQVIWNQISELEKLAIEFLLQTSLKKNRSERFTLVFEELSKRNLDKQIFKEIERTDKYISNIKLGEEYFSLKWIIENNKADYWNSVQGRQDKTFEGTIKSTEYLLLKFLVDLSVQVWDLHILNIMYNTGNEIKSAIGLIKSLDLKKFVQNAEKEKNEYSPLINFYYNKIMCALDETNESYFFEMREYFDKNYHLFDEREQSNSIITLANYCAHKMRLGNRKFLKILFEINNFRIEKEIGIYLNGRINKSLYHQMIRNALSLGEIKWAENFVKKFTPKLKKEHQKTMSSMAMGYICYAKKDFVNSLKYLNNVEFIDLRDKLHFRILSAKANYELNNTELLFYFIDSSKHFIGKNPSIDINTKESYLLFFKYLNRLLTCKENPEQKKLSSLKEDIDLDSLLRLRHKSWLLEKLCELSKN